MDQDSAKSRAPRERGATHSAAGASLVRESEHLGLVRRDGCERGGVRGDRLADVAFHREKLQLAGDAFRAPRDSVQEKPLSIRAGLVVDDLGLGQRRVAVELLDGAVRAAVPVVHGGASHDAQRLVRDPLEEDGRLRQHGVCLLLLGFNLVDLHGAGGVQDQQFALGVHAAARAPPEANSG